MSEQIIRRKIISVVVAGSALALVLGSCSSSDRPSGNPSKTAAGGSSSRPAASGLSGPTVPADDVMQQSLGAGEGALKLIAWAGYVEDGTNDKTVDWVTPFAESTGCNVEVKVAATSEEMVRLVKSGNYDGVSASGDVTLEMIYSGDVAPVNTDLVPNYKTVSGFLKNRPWNSVVGQMYGIPHGWGVNLLMSRRDLVTPPPTSWGAVFDPQSPYRGKVTAYDSPIYIADAALYLRTSRPELKITDPYELDQAQFAAAVDLLKQQRPLIGEYWSSYTKEISAFEGGDSVIGTTWQVIANLVDAGGKAKVNAVIPSEGSTGWSDTWMIAAKAQHPNCMYRWMDWITSATVNAQVAEWVGQAPAQTLACAQTVDKKHCSIYHAGDADYAKKIEFWTTPLRDCGDSRGPVCQDYATWTRAWKEIRG